MGTKSSRQALSPIVSPVNHADAANRGYVSQYDTPPYVYYNTPTLPQPTIAYDSYGYSTPTPVIYNERQSHPCMERVAEVEDNPAGDGDSCVICMDNKPIISPQCGHLNLCGKCTREMLSKVGVKNTCPICRAEITYLTRVFS